MIIDDGVGLGVNRGVGHDVCIGVDEQVMI